MRWEACGSTSAIGSSLFGLWHRHDLRATFLHWCSSSLLNTFFWSYWGEEGKKIRGRMELQWPQSPLFMVFGIGDDRNSLLSSWVPLDSGLLVIFGWVEDLLVSYTLMELFNFGWLLLCLPSVFPNTLIIGRWKYQSIIFYWRWFMTSCLLSSSTATPLLFYSIFFKSLFFLSNTIYRPW